MRPIYVILVKAAVVGFFLNGGGSYAQHADSTERITECLNSYTRAIKTEFSSSTEDLNSLVPILQGKRLVSVGEATHGTREFAEIKARLFKFLVEQMGFNVLALEADFGGALGVNRYIQGIDTDGESALKRLKFFHCVNQETLTLIRWMREYNARQTDERKKVKFYGFDFGFPDNSVKEIARIVSKVDSSAAQKVAQTETVEYAILIGEYVKHEDIDTIAKLLSTYLARYDNAQKRDLDLASRLVEVLRQNNRITSRGNRQDSVRSRDLFMKQNIDWILKFEGPEAKIMLWSHNDHARYGTMSSTWAHNMPTMGLGLKRHYGDELYTIGFDFNKGGFYANLVSRHPDSKKLTVFEVADAPIGTLAWQLSKVKKDVFFLDFGETGTNTTIRMWLSQKHRVRYVGGGYIVGDDCLRTINCSFHPYHLSQAFDGLFFVNHTHPITQLIR